jgi:FADH2 O2-dependent halogenase
MTPDFDVAIIGGGPAGSAMAAYIAKAGAKCVLLERELFPRPHVGESLVPSSTRVFKELDFLPKMEAHKFPHKFGAIWTAGANAPLYNHDWEGLAADSHAGIRFEEREQPGVDKNYTYHVDRGQFDLLLMQHAHEFGAEVYEGVGVQRVDFDSGPLTEVRFQMGKRELGVTARMVIDASGRKTILGNQLKLKIKDPVFDQYALHTWFEGYDRRTLLKKPEQADYIYIHFLPLTNSWLWQIPITSTITSFGVVTQKKHFAKSRKEREDFFWECISSRPELFEALKRADQIRPLKEEGDYSYAMSQICGDRYVMIGDAARFVDPIFSTGVSIALNSARFAASDVLKALETGDCSKKAFERYESTLRRGTNNWYKFIGVYYRLNVLFTAFIRDPRYRLDVLKLLQGDVYDEDEPEVLKIMRDTVKQVEENPDHVWHKSLGDLTANAFKPLF